MAKQPLPTRRARAVFKAKANVLCVARWWSDIRLGQAVDRHPLTDALTGRVLAAQSLTPLWDDDAPAAERLLQAGKVQNLRVAARQLDGCLLQGGSTFSFWAQIGRPVSARGYAVGRELRQGCLIPTVGGGLCQLSNALYDCALTARLEILERHRHSQIVPGSTAARDRDATVFWNYVDLRFRSERTLQVTVLLSARTLEVRLWTTP